MSDGMDPLEVRLARVEERMKTMQAEYRSDIAALARDIADRHAEATQRQADAADRMARWGWWQLGLNIAVIGLATALILHVLAG